MCNIAIIAIYRSCNNYTSQIQYHSTVLERVTFYVSTVLYVHAYLFKHQKTRLRDNHPKPEQVRDAYCFIINNARPTSCEIKSCGFTKAKLMAL